MAIKYTKPLKTAVIKTLNGATTVTVSDTVDSPKASSVIAEFESGRTLHADGTFIPFHAVDSIVVTLQTSEEISKDDPYCPEPSTDPEP